MNGVTSGLAYTSGSQVVLAVDTTPTVSLRNAVRMHSNKQFNAVDNNLFIFDVEHIPGMNIPLLHLFYSSLDIFFSRLRNLACHLGTYDAHATNFQSLILRFNAQLVGPDWSNGGTSRLLIMTLYMLTPGQVRLMLWRPSTCTTATNTPSIPDPAAPPLRRFRTCSSLTETIVAVSPSPSH